MNKPVILAVDDDPEVLQAIARDLRRQYAEQFRIIRADSGKAGLDALQELKLRNDTVALFLVDQRMPQMTGVEFLEQASVLFPEGKRVLLTAYADTEAAIRAINVARLDYYLLKPWDPPDERLYPVLDDLLDDWRANFHPEFQGIRVVGDRWSPDSHRIKDFLTRNQIPYRWLDIERHPEAKTLLDYARVEGPCLPLVLYSDGSHMTRPKNLDIAERIGLQTQATKPFYDLVIIGGGPGGLAAAVYGASEGLKTVMIEREAPGGQAGTSSRIENYLGFPVGLSGGDLARRAVTQARRFGVEILTPQEAKNLRIENDYRMITLQSGAELSCHAVILALGVSWRRLAIPGIDQFTGAGVYYGAAQTEALECADEDVYIVGGANSAGQAAMYFSRYARKVVMLVRGDSLTKSMSQYLIDQIEATENIEVWTFSSVIEVKGNGNLEALVIENSKTGEVQTLPTRYLFIFIGAVPNTEWLDGVVQRDDRGFILTGPDLTKEGEYPRGWSYERSPYLLETNIPGIFAVGDVRYGSIKRVASGVGEGSICVQFVHRYLSNL
ncbi:MULTISPECIES: FAD-dependent oxidoreductase [unclassified Leptolyngbya]|uniref:FAD-dependent oxidoreductase n=1 Tax=unclassified Leptolyngbya TaxID=2650499 RepID=UPI001683CEE7|nr:MULTISPECIES: FAD-dependent oxidoreductase [unclassified Leptolyngbya]MBD1909449.1 FAD-dependent oxidoreductase [Leptolyngbya sp. FACHB-8]MBD2155654.1 FAD-dependent oxidoreductase [Leptolyngbya sp. FACHB-16]